MYKKIDYKSKYALSKIQNIEDKNERIKNYKVAIKQLQKIDLKKYEKAKQIESLKFFNISLNKKYLTDINKTESGLKRQFKELQKLANRDITKKAAKKKKETARNVLKELGISESELRKLDDRKLSLTFQKVSEIQKDKRYNIINAKRDEKTGKMILSNDTDITSLAERSVLTSDQVIKMVYDVVSEEIKSNKTFDEINKELDDIIERQAQEMEKVKENQLNAVLKMSFN